jgi:hypothetical protein
MVVATAMPVSDCLLVLDSRTAKSYQIPIRDNSVLGSDLGKILSPSPPVPEDEIDGAIYDAGDKNGNGHTNGHTNGNGVTNGHSNGNGVVAKSPPLQRLRILDVGLENTACMKSSITLMYANHLAQEQVLIYTDDKQQ